jgi:prepilin-type processing-associated H-X9-DG protein
MMWLRIGVAVSVVAVFAVVTGLVGQKRGEDVKRLAAARNLQQWGIALNLHLIDHDNQLPAVGTTPVDASQKSAWFNALPPYISQTPLTDLPPGQRPRPGVPSLWIDPVTKPVKVWDPEVFFFNYAMNRALQPDLKVRSFRIYEVPSPGNVIFMAEVEGYSPSCSQEDVVFRHGAMRSGDPNASAHVLFCDGHVQAIPRKVLLNPSALRAESASDGPSWFAH